MSRVTRTATIQLRVVPLVKAASERVLWRMGLNMSEAVELFLRRVIVDERIPFEVAALDAGHIALTPDIQWGGERVEGGPDGDLSSRSTASVRTGAPKKEFKKFSRARTSSPKHAQKRQKNRA